MAEKKTAAKTEKVSKKADTVKAQPRLKELYNKELKAKLSKPHNSAWRPLSAFLNTTR